MAWRTIKSLDEFKAIISRANAGEFKLRGMARDQKRNSWWHVQTSEPSMGRRGKEVIFGKLK